MTLSPINLSKSSVKQLIDETKKHSDYKQLTPEQRKAVKLIFERKKEGESIAFTEEKDIKILQAAGINGDGDMEGVCTALGKTEEKSRSPWYTRFDKGFSNTFLGRVSSKELQSVVEQTYEEKIQELAESFAKTPRPVPKKSGLELPLLSVFRRPGSNLTRHERALLAEIKEEAGKKVAADLKQNPPPGLLANLKDKMLRGGLNRLFWEQDRIGSANKERQRIAKLLPDSQAPQPTPTSSTQQHSKSSRGPMSGMFAFSQRTSSKPDKSTILREIELAQNAELQRCGIDAPQRKAGK